MSSTATHYKMITGEVKERIDRWISNYPADQRQSAVMPALRIVQEVNGGHLTTELMDEVADYLGMAPIAVYEVATFYGNYEHKPVGKYKLCVCNSISCMLRGKDEVIEYLEEKLGVKVGEVTPDGKFSIKKVECLGACGGAPMMQIGKKYYENLTKESIDEILAGLE
ncbi:MAG: NADH-quinone oxidoreductase subunit NuoE [Gammaproteobacteria bacterium]|nr:NADH-quinone oxidoreductase subunit NuoE [Gammaproteobacteria bacterium]MBD3775541.1 NADH-quinone oxidoreductase subunit NuoE [Thiotrichales bacterium]